MATRRRITAISGRQPQLDQLLIPVPDRREQGKQGAGHRHHRPHPRYDEVRPFDPSSPLFGFDLFFLPLLLISFSSLFPYMLSLSV